MKKKKLYAILTANAVAFGLLTGCDLSKNDVPSSQPEQTPTSTSTQTEPNQITNVADPLTGMEKAADYPEGQRPAAVMISNIKAALPQRGLNDADLLYEIVTEGGVTRIMAVYRDYRKMPAVGPVRSARDQHVQLMLPMGALYAHIGGSTYAEQMLDAYKWTNIKEIDGKYRNFYWIDSERRKTTGQEHCVFTDGENFGRAIKEFNMDSTGHEPAPVFDFVPYDQPKRELTGGDAEKIYVRFSGYSTSSFEYRDGQYYKFQFEKPQMDQGTNTQLAVDNVLVLFGEINKYPDGILTHVQYDWGGAGYYFCNGKYEKIRWKKERPESPLQILDAEGNETNVKINPGSTYVAIVGNDQIENFSINEVKLGQMESNPDEEIILPD